jgi:hypothetical protein
MDSLAYDVHGSCAKDQINRSWIHLKPILTTAEPIISWVGTKRDSSEVVI